MIENTSSVKNQSQNPIPGPSNVLKRKASAQERNFPATHFPRFCDAHDLLERRKREALEPRDIWGGKKFQLQKASERSSNQSSLRWSWTLEVPHHHLRRPRCKRGRYDWGRRGRVWDETLLNNFQPIARWDHWPFRYSALCRFLTRWHGLCQWSRRRICSLP